MAWRENETRRENVPSHRSLMQENRDPWPISALLLSSLKH